MAAPSDDRLTEDILFLACTRPAMVLGVPMEAMGLIVMVSAVAFLAGDSLLYLLVAPGLWLTCRGICRTDHNAFRVLLAFIETKGRARNRTVWGGSSSSPLALRRQLTAREVDRG